jgi:hypothetical protein
MWFKPRHTFQSVVDELIQGLEDGTIILDSSQDASLNHSDQDKAKIAERPAAREQQRSPIG